MVTEKWRNVWTNLRDDNPDFLAWKQRATRIVVSRFPTGKIWTQFETEKRKKNISSRKEKENHSGTNGFKCASAKWNVITVLPLALKRKFKIGDECSFAREFQIIRQRIQFVIAIIEIEQAQANFGVAFRKTVASKNVELPEIIAGFVRTIASITLRPPDGFGFRKKSAAMIELRE